MLDELDAPCLPPTQTLKRLEAAISEVNIFAAKGDGKWPCDDECNIMHDQPLRQLSRKQGSCHWRRALCRWLRLLHALPDLATRPTILQVVEFSFSSAKLVHKHPAVPLSTAKVRHTKEN